MVLMDFSVIRFIETLILCKRLKINGWFNHDNFYRDKILQFGG
jgi:hypothetical protein